MYYIGFAFSVVCCYESIIGFSPRRAISDNARSAEITESQNQSWNRSDTESPAIDMTDGNIYPTTELAVATTCRLGLVLSAIAM